MHDNNSHSKDDRVKKFLNWVNADEDMPSLEELGYNVDDDDDDEHHDEDHIPSHAPKPLESEELTEDYEGDDEFMYPDEVAEEDDEPQNIQDEECVTGDEDTYVVHREEIHMTKRQKTQMMRFRAFYLILSAIVAVNVIVVLLVTVNYLPEFGSQYNPSVNEVYLRYVEMGVEDTGSLNMVAAVLFSYRSFDTLGEAFVLFTAVIGVLILMRKPTKEV